MFGRCSANGARNGGWMGIQWRLTGGVDMKRELPRSGKRADPGGAAEIILTRSVSRGFSLRAFLISRFHPAPEFVVGDSLPGADALLGVLENSAELRVVGHENSLPIVLVAACDQSG